MKIFLCVFKNIFIKHRKYRFINHTCTASDIFVDYHIFPGCSHAITRHVKTEGERLLQATIFIVFRLQIFTNNNLLGTSTRNLRRKL